VIVPALTWISTGETVTQAGAKPVFVDIEPGYYTIDPSKIEEKITANTRAIVPVHLYGQVCDMEQIMAIANKHGLYVIEDCAQSHFSEYKGKRAGLFGTAGSFSFYPGKNLGAYGDAGCIITNDDQLANRCRLYARHGAQVKHQHEMEGINSRLDGIHAAVLSVKLDHIDEWTGQRIVNAAAYDKAFKSNTAVITPKVRPGTKHTYHLYVVRVKNREELQNFLNSEGIETSIHYPTPLPFMKAYEYLGHGPADFPVSFECKDEILSIPMYPELTREQINFVAGRIEQFYANVHA
jgi:dTDP-4-amino-4,6-dideoxygalactose transaminase